MTKKDEQVESFLSLRTRQNESPLILLDYAIFVFQILMIAILCFVFFKGILQVVKYCSTDISLSFIT